MKSFSDYIEQQTKNYLESDSPRMPRRNLSSYIESRVNSYLSEEVNKKEESND